jgi:hypothetical protein
VSNFRNVLACLVHEKPECVLDLVRNLHCLDPESVILLYNGGRDPDLLRSLRAPLERSNAFVYPKPTPLVWGTLHQFAIDSMRWAISNGPFDALTIVDSDQLMLRPGYSSALARFLASRPDVGLVGSTEKVEYTRGKRSRQSLIARREIALWRPFLAQFPAGESNFVQFTFWPSTVFTGRACRELVALWDRDTKLRDIMECTQIWPTEEIILPTLVALLGFDIASSPFRSSFVRYRTGFSLPHLERAFRFPHAHWMHPVPRRHDDPLRCRIRERFEDYETPATRPGPPLEFNPMLAPSHPSRRRTTFVRPTNGAGFERHIVHPAQIPRGGSRNGGGPRFSARSKAPTGAFAASSAVVTVRPPPAGHFDQGSFCVAFDDSPVLSPKPVRQVRVYQVSPLGERAAQSLSPFRRLASARHRSAHADASIAVARKHRADWRDRDYVGVFDAGAWVQSGMSPADLSSALDGARFAHDVYIVASGERATLCGIASRTHPLGEGIVRRLLNRHLRLPERLLTRAIPVVVGGLWLARPVLFERFVQHWLIPARRALEGHSDHELAQMLDTEGTNAAQSQARDSFGAREAIRSTLLESLALAFFSHSACRIGFLARSAGHTETTR